MKLQATLPVFCLLALAFAQDSPQRCTSPDQMEGILSMFHPLQFEADYGRFSYDAINKRIYSDLFITREERTWQQVDILLFEESVMYHYYPQNNTCLKAPLPIPFQKTGVPKDATSLGPSFIGIPQIPNAGLQCNAWNGIANGVYYIVVFTDFDCFPLYLSEVFKTGWFSISYFNITVGIRDPTIFTPPPACEDLVHETSPSQRLHPWVLSSASLG